MDTADDGVAAVRQLLADAGLQHLWEACVNVGAESVENLRFANDHGLLSKANGFKPVEAVRLQLALGKRQREEAAPPAARPPPPSPPPAPAPAPQAIESPPSPVFDAKSRALDLSMEMVDDEEVSDDWKAAARKKRHELKKAKKVGPFMLLHRPGEGSALKNGSMDVLLQCCVPGCSKGLHEVRNKGISKVGGGSRNGCSLENYNKHLESQGHRTNATNYLRQLKLNEKGRGPAPPPFVRLSKAPPPPQPTSLGAGTAPPLDLSDDPRERMQQIMSCDSISDNFMSDLGRRRVVCRLGCQKDGKDWSTTSEDSRVISTLKAHINSTAHQRQDGTLLGFVAPVRRCVEIPKLENGLLVYIADVH